jgi:hypothetical protein
MNGRIGTPAADRFSFGVNVANPASPEASLNSAWAILGDETKATTLRNACTAFFSSAGAKISNNTYLEEIKFAQIEPDPVTPSRGMYAKDPVIWTVAVAGGGGATYVPLPQASFVVSLVTNRRGPTGKGRFYLPCPALSPSPTDGFRIPVAEANAVQAAAWTWLVAINNAFSTAVPNPKVSVCSTKGYATAVSGVRVGRIIDTMTSRRNNLVESYGGMTAIA